MRDWNIGIDYFVEEFGSGYRIIIPKTHFWYLSKNAQSQIIQWADNEYGFPIPDNELKTIDKVIDSLGPKDEEKYQRYETQMYGKRFWEK